jgi:hypothetical protein
MSKKKKLKVAVFLAALKMPAKSIRKMDQKIGKRDIPRHFELWIDH